MGLQGLGAKAVRRMERVTGETIVRGTVNNGNDFSWWFFTTADHRHGAFNRFTEEFEFDEDIGCTSLCRTLFPDVPPKRHEEDL